MPDRQPLMTQRHRKPPATRASPPFWSARCSRRS